MAGSIARRLRQLSGLGCVVGLTWALGWGSASSQTREISPVLAAAPAASVASIDLQTYSAAIETLATFLGDRGQVLDARQLFEYSFFDLNDDGTRDALIRLSGPNWCGTGGCTLLVLRGKGDRFEILSQSTLVQTPLMAADTKTAGWRDLLVNISGGGLPSRTVALRFDGQAYPPNPTTNAPVVTGNPNGTILFTENGEPRAAFDLPQTEATCLNVAAERWQMPPEQLTLTFSRADEGAAAYHVTMRTDASRQGLCRSRFDGSLEVFSSQL